MERTKMPIGDRAKQFAPFDALKGLHDALRIKEFEHEMKIAGEKSADEVAAISEKLLSINQDEFITITYFDGDSLQHLSGHVIIDFENYLLKIDDTVVEFRCIEEIVK